MKLLVIADDYTGALDTGVQFAARSISTVVSSNLVTNADVVVVDTDTRHLSPQAAYRVVYDLVKTAASKGFSHFYKKIDSVLRGNVGAELRAFKDALECECVPVLPAYPENGRITKNGIQYINGIPLAESIFGHDPFQPIRYSTVLDIIAQQADPQGFCVMDAETDAELMEYAFKVDSRATAGCAGFAKYIPEMLEFPITEKKLMPIEPEFVVVCGSVHRLTLEQLQYARDRGYPWWALNESHKSGDEEVGLPEWQNGLIIAANESQEDIIGIDDLQVKKRVAYLLGKIAAHFAKQNKTVVVFGGDTLRETMDILGCTELIPVRELLPGIVLSQSSKGGFTFVSKSGGFGSVDVLEQIRSFLESAETVKNEM